MMKYIRLIVFLLGVLAPAVDVRAQSHAELLQKAIYAEDTLGDVETARALYLKVIAGTPQGSPLRQQAQRRLETITQRQQAHFVVPDGVPRAVVARGTYMHTQTGMRILMPQGWKAGSTTPSSDDGEMVTLSFGPPSTSLNIWMRADANDWQGINDRLDESPRLKAESRLQTGYANYQLRPGSVQRVVINGQQAMVATADYSDRAGPMSEYMVWIYTEKSHIFFFSRMPATQLDEVRHRLDELVHRAIIP